MILGIDTSGETCYIALIDQANDAVKCTQFNHNRQLIEQLPTEPHDMPLTAVVTPTRLYGSF